MASSLFSRWTNWTSRRARPSSSSPLPASKSPPSSSTPTPEEERRTPPITICPFFSSPWWPEKSGRRLRASAASRWDENCDQNGKSGGGKRPSDAFSSFVVRLSVSRRKREKNSCCFSFLPPPLPICYLRGVSHADLLPFLFGGTFLRPFFAPIKMGETARVFFWSLDAKQKEYRAGLTKKGCKEHCSISLLLPMLRHFFFKYHDFFKKNFSNVNRPATSADIMS